MFLKDISPESFFFFFLNKRLGLVQYTLGPIFNNKSSLKLLEQPRLVFFYAIVRLRPSWAKSFFFLPGLIYFG